MRAITLAHKIRRLISRKHPGVADFSLTKLQEVIEQHEMENVRQEADKKLKEDAKKKKPL